MNSLMDQLPSAVQGQVDRIVICFELALQGKPDVDDFLALADCDNPPLLVELILRHLGHRLKDGQTARIEEYLARYPELARNRQARLALVQGERDLRKLSAKAACAEYGERFPDCRAELTALFTSSRADGTSPSTDLPEDDASTRHEDKATGPYLPGANGADLDQEPVLPKPRGATRYRVIRPHREGGLGEVFVAEDLELHREVALKEIKKRYAHEAFRRKRFVVEAEITGNLEHPGIVPVYGLGAYPDGRPYYAMKFIRGDNLHAAISRFHAQPGNDFGSLEFRGLLRRFIDTCNAVAYAHSRGVIHRDLKPLNVMLGEFGETLVVDWGLAKVIPVPLASVGVGDEGAGEGATASDQAPRLERLRLDGDEAETVAGIPFGTPGFMSPEQAAGNVGQIGRSSDVYSLGATLFNVLTGKSCLPPGDEDGMLARTKRGDVLTPESVRADVPKALAAVCKKAMALRPEERYGSALDLANEVEHWLADEPVSACVEPWFIRAGRFGRKHRTLVTSAVATLLVGLFGLTFGLIIVGGLNRDLREANSSLHAARNDAETKRQEAETQREVAQTVNVFVQNDLLAEAAPEKNARDRKVTVEEVLGRAARRIAGKFDGKPRIEASIRLTVGVTYQALGDYAAAQPHLERAWELHRGVLGDEHPDTLRSVNGLATLYHAQGQYTKAEPLYFKIQEVSRRVLGDEHPDTLNYENNLAGLYRDQGHTAKAEPLFVRTLDVIRRVLGEEHPNTLSSMNNLAELYRNQGRPSKAEPILAKVLEQRIRIQGEEHPDTLNAMNNLAELYKDQAQFANAHSLYTKALQIQTRVLGEDHPDTLSSVNNLATLYQVQGQLAKAEPLFDKAIAGNRRILGDDHPNTLGSMNNLAILYLAQGQLTKAEPLLLKTVEGSRRGLGEDHPNTLVAMISLARLFQTRGQFAKAEPLLVKTLESRKRVLGEEHHDTIMVLHDLAETYRAQFQFDKAEMLVLKVLDLRMRLIGEERPETLSSMNNLAALYHAQGQFSKAEPLYVRLLEVSRRVLGEEHSDRLDFTTNLAAMYRDQGQFAKAEPLYLKTLEVRERVLGEEHPDTLHSMNNLAALYRDQGHFQKAGPLYVRTLELRRRVLGQEHPHTLSSMHNLGRTLFFLKDYPAAEGILVPCQTSVEKNPNVSSVLRWRVMESLIMLYDAWGKPAEAAKLRAKLPLEAHIRIGLERSYAWPLLWGWGRW